MRNIIIVLMRFISMVLIGIVVIMSVNFIVYNRVMPIVISDYKYLLPILVFFPLDQLYWGRYIQRSFDHDNFNKTNWDKVLVKYNVNELSSDNVKKVYKIPFLKFFFPSEIIVENTETKVVITAPKRVFYDYEKG